MSKFSEAIFLIFRATNCLFLWNKRWSQALEWGQVESLIYSPACRLLRRMVNSAVCLVYIHIFQVCVHALGNNWVQDCY